VPAVTGGNDDALADAVALVETMRAGDLEGLSAVVGNMASYEVALSLAGQWGALLDELGVPPARYRSWAQDAEGRQPPILVCALADACRVPGAGCAGAGGRVRFPGAAGRHGGRAHVGVGGEGSWRGCHAGRAQPGVRGCPAVAGGSQ
jgi:hypothetical protein